MVLRLSHSVFSFFAAICCAACGASVPPESAVSRPEPEPVEVRLLFTGDVMQHLPQITAARRDGGFDYSEVFRYVRPRFDAADLVVVNFETTLTDSPRYAGYPCFRSPTALADALRDAGVDVATLANNHCCDGGAEGVRTTLRELDRCGIRHTGVCAASCGPAAHHPLRLMIRGVRFAFVNYTYGTNGLPDPCGVQVNRIDTARMARDLAGLAKDSVDCIVACMHWGNEYERQENAAQRELAAWLRRRGVDIVIGHHPHVVQPFEADSVHAVFYSLGNFVSNQRQRYRDGGVMAGIRVTRLPDGSMRYAAEAIPVWVALPRYRVLPPEAADTMRLPTAYALFRADCAALLEKNVL